MAWLGAGLALLFGLSPAAAQEVKGTALDAASGRPIEGAFVSVTDSVGREVVSSLTSADGTFLLHVFVRGNYRLKVERIGFATWTSRPFEAGTGIQVARSLRIPVRPIDLAELEVAVESRCSRRGVAGEELLRVWDEARKALLVTRWAEASPAIRFDLRRWVRLLHPRTHEVRDEEANRVTKTGRSSFISLSAHQLREVGYVQRQEDRSYQFYGPDAEVLLSDAFFGDHCLTLVTGELESAGLIGLAFEPVERSGKPDVKGVLWLDPLTNELRHMEFEYTELDRVDIPGDPWAGGRVEFRRAPSGVWFVSRWWIRAPVMERAVRPTLRRGAQGLFLSDRLTTALEAYREFGGEVLKIGLPDGSEIALGEWGTVVGRMMRFGGQRPLPGARVYLTGTPHEARTDSIGRFRLDFVSPGRYTLAAEHPDPRLEGFSSVERTVNVRGEEVRRVTIEPSPDLVARTLCGQSEASEDLVPAILMGRVIDEETNQLLPGAVVWLRDASAEDATPIRTDDEGYFLVCGLQPTPSLQVQATSLGRVGEPLDMQVQEGALLLRDLAVSEVGVADVSEVAETAASLRGVVKSADTGDPVAGARIRLLNAAEERITSADGTFVVAGLDTGLERIVTEHLGMTSDTAEVFLTAGTMSLALFTLETDPVPLPELEVQIERTVGNLRLAGFYERMDRGIGQFISRDDLEHRDIVMNFRRLQGVRVNQCVRRGSGQIVDLTSQTEESEGQQPQQQPERLPAFAQTVSNCWEIQMSRLRLSRPCRPIVYLNGHPLGGVMDDEVMARFVGENPFTIIAQLPPDMIEGIEVHRNAATAPAQYHGFGAGCGIILVWTRDRRSS